MAGYKHGRVGSGILSGVCNLSNVVRISGSLITGGDLEGCEQSRAGSWRNIIVHVTIWLRELVWHSILIPLLLAIFLILIGMSQPRVLSSPITDSMRS